MTPVSQNKQRKKYSYYCFISVCRSTANWKKPSGMQSTASKKKRGTYSERDIAADADESDVCIVWRCIALQERLACKWSRVPVTMRPNLVAHYKIWRGPCARARKGMSVSSWRGRYCFPCYIKARTHTRAYGRERRVTLEWELEEDIIIYAARV